MIEKISMSLFELLYLLITAGGFVALSVQLWIQRCQMKLLISGMEATADVSVAQRTLEADRIFVERPHLRAYFLGGAVPVQRHLDEALSMALLLLNFWDTYYIQTNKGLSQMYSGIAWEQYLGLYFKNSPTLCQTVEDNKEIFTDKMFECMRRHRGVQVKTWSESRPKFLPSRSRCSWISHRQSLD